MASIADGSTAKRLVRALGGPHRVSREITRRVPGVPLSPQAVCRWYANGVPWRRRGVVRELCLEHDPPIPLPPGFINQAEGQTA